MNISCERAALAVSDYGGHACGSFASEKNARQNLK